jgi:hypothetical protein
MTTGANPIKLVTDFHNKLRVFIPGKPFQSSLMFGARPEGYPRVEHLEELLHSDGLLSYLQKLD